MLRLYADRRRRLALATRRRAAQAAARRAPTIPRTPTCRTCSSCSARASRTSREAPHERRQPPRRHRRHASSASSRSPSRRTRRTSSGSRCARRCCRSSSSAPATCRRAARCSSPTRASARRSSATSSITVDGTPERQLEGARCGASSAHGKHNYFQSHDQRPRHRRRRVASRSSSRACPAAQPLPYSVAGQRRRPLQRGARPHRRRDLLLLDAQRLLDPHRRQQARLVATTETARCPTPSHRSFQPVARATWRAGRRRALRRSRLARWRAFCVDGSGTSFMKMANASGAWPGAPA